MVSLLFSIIAGLIGLLIGGTLLVQAAVAIAARLGVSPLLIGLVLVGFGTSTPELLTSLSAALAGAPGIATGNVVGSNIANILLILGLTALLRPMVLARDVLLRDGIAIASSWCLCCCQAMWGGLRGQYCAPSWRLTCSTASGLDQQSQTICPTSPKPP